MTFSDRIFSNASGNESIRNALYLLADQSCDVFLVSPFFSDDALIDDLLQRECTVRLIVKLGPRTDPGALARLVQKPGIQIRYFTSPTFHTKLYIFGQRGALVGSANLTRAGISSNREIAITVDPADERFDQLLALFQSYWGHPAIGMLTPQRCAEYAEVARLAIHPQDTFEGDILSKFGDLAPEGIQVGGTKKESKEKVYLSSYQKVYDEFLAAYRRVEERYKAFARRKKPEAEIPLRIEIDQFFSYIREIFAKEESYGQQPIRTGNDLGANLDQHLGLWFDTDWAYLDEVMVSYARINQVLGSSDSIQRADAHELFDALTVCHSVYDRRRFFAGGLSTFRDEFVRQNDIVKVRSTLTFLVHGQGDFVERMATCIFDEDFKLKQFGRSAVQETYGWVNKENVPICNGRTVKSLRWLGFNVLIFN